MHLNACLVLKKTTEILQDFLECVLDLKSEKIAGLELLDKELKKEHIEDKTFTIPNQQSGGT